MENISWGFYITLSTKFIIVQKKNPKGSITSESRKKNVPDFTDKIEIELWVWSNNRPPKAFIQAQFLLSNDTIIKNRPKIIPRSPTYGCQENSHLENYKSRQIHKDNHYKDKSNEKQKWAKKKTNFSHKEVHMGWSPIYAGNVAT